MTPTHFNNRKFVIGAITIGIVIVFMLRLAALQLLSEDFKKTADSNAFRKELIHPSRGLIFDRNDSLMVYNEPSYNIMITMEEQLGIDTLDFCRAIGITKTSTLSAVQR